jgi:hypothetical protein
MKGYAKCKNDTTNSYVKKYVAMRVVCSCIKKNNLTRCISYLVINDFKNIRARILLVKKKRRWYFTIEEEQNKKYNKKLKKFII